MPELAMAPLAAMDAGESRGFQVADELSDFSRHGEEWWKRSRVSSL